MLVPVPDPLTRVVRASLAILFVLLLPSSVDAQTLTKGIAFSPLQSANPCVANTSCMWVDPTNEQVHFFDGTTAKTVPTVIANAKGDLAVFNGTTWVAVPPGSDGACLQSQSGQSSGLLWGSCGGTVSGTTGQVAIFTGSNAVGGTNNFTADTSGNVVVATSVTAPQFQDSSGDKIVWAGGGIYVYAANVLSYQVVGSGIYPGAVGARSLGNLTTYWDDIAVETVRSPSTITLQPVGADNFVVSSTDASATIAETSGTGITAQVSEINLNVNGAPLAFASTNAFAPYQDLTTSFGSSGHRPTEVWSRHFAGSQTTVPTASNVATNVSTPTITGSDASMVLTFSITGVPGSTALFTVNYNAAYAVKPSGVQIRPCNSAAANADATGNFFYNYDSANSTTSGFEVDVVSTSVSMTNGKLCVSVIQ